MIEMIYRRAPLPVLRGEWCARGRRHRTIALLERWYERAIPDMSVADVFDEPS